MEGRIKSQNKVLLFAFLMCCCVINIQFVEADETSQDEDFLEMSFEDLLEEPFVISASRQEQKSSELSVPVTLITSEDIHNSGLTSIPEILQFAAGVDVLRLDRNRYAVGVRGLHDMTSDRTLVLVNGRIVNSALFGGSEFYRLPILVEDIDRIEIVRGPGGAAWGANAFTGVINIITKKPEDMLGAFATSTINEYGDSYTHLRLAQKDGKWAWRISIGYEDKESSDKAGAGDYSSIGTPTLNALMGFSSFKADDFSRDYRLGFETINYYSEQTTFTFGGDFANDEQGSFEFMGYHPDGHVLLFTASPYAKVDHTFDDGSTGYVQWFSNFINSKVPSIVEWSTLENDIEAQLNFEHWNNHNASIGGNLRLIRVDAEKDSSSNTIFNGDPFDEQLAGLFLIDRWFVNDSLTLEGQIRGDWYSGTHTDWSSRLSVLKTLDTEKYHTIRFSGAKAYRAPFSGLRRASISQVDIDPLDILFPGPGTFYALNVIEADDLDNEQTWSLEAGYSGRLSEKMTMGLNTYYQIYDDLIGYDVLTDPLGLGRTIYQADNVGGADSYGAELEIKHQVGTGNISAWYAYNEFQLEKSGQSSRAFGPAKHKAGLTYRLKLSETLLANINYKYADTTPTYTTSKSDIGSSNRFDVLLAKKFAGGSAEFSCGVMDIFNETNGPNISMAELTSHETPGRTFFARLQCMF